MTAFQDVVNDPPSAEDLAWIADRLSLLVLPRDQQEWFHNLAREIFEAWPNEEKIVEAQQEADDELWNRLEGELLALGVPIEVEEDNGSDEIVAAVKSALEHAREEGVKDATIPSRANTAARKALRLLVDGRVSIKRVVDDGDLKGLVVAEVRGDSGEIHTCGHDPRRRQWRCTCPEMKGDCSHLTAVKMIVPIPRGDTP